jgi:CheY-like chemotaxis protein
LTFSRQQVVEPRTLDLNEVVRGTEKMLRRLIEENVVLHTVLDPALGQVRADPGQVEQVIMNLAVNARDAMPQQGRLTLETANVELDEAYAQTRPTVKPGAYVRLAVSDTGHGMTAEVKTRLFEPFFTTKGPGKGTGLGLATVFGIVQQAGGNIDVYSELERGTTFKVYFPRAEPERLPAAPPPPRPTTARGHETILVVEDEPAVRTLTRFALQGFGYTILEAGNGLEALARVEGHAGPIHLLVSDVIMPELGGPRLVQQLRERRPELKVLFVSGYTSDAVVQHGVLEAEVAFLQKPFTIDALSRKVRALLDTQ